MPNRLRGPGRACHSDCRSLPSQIRFDQHIRARIDAFVTPHMPHRLGAELASLPSPCLPATSLVPQLVTTVQHRHGLAPTPRPRRRHHHTPWQSGAPRGVRRALMSAPTATGPRAMTFHDRHAACGERVGLMTSRLGEPDRPGVCSQASFRSPQSLPSNRISWSGFDIFDPDPECILLSSIRSRSEVPGHDPDSECASRVDRAFSLRKGKRTRAGSLGASTGL